MKNVDVEYGAGLKKVKKKSPGKSARKDRHKKFGKGTAVEKKEGFLIVQFEFYWYANGNTLTQIAAVLPRVLYLFDDLNVEGKYGFAEIFRSVWVTSKNNKT